MTAIDSPAVQFRPLPPERPAPELEAELLALWAQEDLFALTLAARRDGEEFVFYEGPPTANGRPGIHHVFARTIKDLFCRYRAMTGRHVPRKAGWDTHGLPVEIEVEKELATRLAGERGLSPEALERISGKQLIEEYGVERFNQLCRESVWRYRGEWERVSERIGIWLDYADPYVTYSNDYVESVWWALKTLFERDRLYRGHKILPYCARCGTALSSHEVAQGYEDVHDPSVYLALDLVAGGGRGEAQTEERNGLPHSPASRAARLASRRRILVWTTTPWTLVSNVALAVHPELEYVELRKRVGGDWTIILAAERAGAVLGDDYTDRWETVAHVRGSDLAGLRYRRPLDWVAHGEGEHELIVAERFVSAEEGTGVVHVAPAFGADDYAAGQRHGLAFLQPVNARGEFPPEMPLVGGTFVKAADAAIVDELRRRDVLWKAGTIEHSYPHCWRCGTPLLYYARESWFVRTTAYRDQMLARNARVDWHPAEVGEGRFGEWLKNNIDWAISRDRYWGTPLPVWVCDADASHVEVIGSYAELAGRHGRPLADGFDPHKPYIDRYEWNCDHCAGTMRRVPEVIDAWFDSGSMPFAQWHFPFENADVFAREFPGHFIAEGVDQTRGWFYSLLAIAAGLGDALPNNGIAAGSADTAVAASPYRAVVVNGLVVDAAGQKMSKSRGNAVDPWAVIQRHGADAVRLFFVATSQVWVEHRFDESVIRETAGRFLLTLKNTYSGIFAQYANFGWAPSDADPAPATRPLLDRWILSELDAVEREVDSLLAHYDATAAARRVMGFVVDDVSNWYVRLSRARFYDVDAADNRAAFATLHEVLAVSCRLLAPFAPFVSDWIHRELTGRSVHLAAFTRGAQRAEGDPELARAMAAVRTLSRLGRAAREEAGIKVRQPLSRMVCVVPVTTRGSMDALIPLLAGELNVKRVELVSSADTFVTLRAKPNFRALGRKFGKSTKLAAEAVAALSSDALRAFEHGEPLALSVDNESHLLAAEDLTVTRHASGGLVVEEEGEFFAALDPAVTPALRREGLATELKSRVQRMRKDAGFAVSDRIRLHVAGNEEVEGAVREYRDWLGQEVLAREVAIGGEPPEANHAAQTVDLDGLAVRVALTREE